MHHKLFLVYQGRGLLTSYVIPYELINNVTGSGINGDPSQIKMGYGVQMMVNSFSKSRITK